MGKELAGSLQTSAPRDAAPWAIAASGEDRATCLELIS